MSKIEIYHHLNISKHIQIYTQIKNDIQSGKLCQGYKLPSINQFSKSYHIARDTVEKAYNLLKKEGLIKSSPGKGNYVDNSHSPLQILMVLNKLSSYKKQVYDGLVQELPRQVKVNLQVFHYDFNLFCELIDSQKNNYDYCVVMPHFLKEIPELTYINFLKTISPDKLVVLDKKVLLGRNVINVYQDFERDI